MPILEDCDCPACRANAAKAEAEDLRGQLKSERERIGKVAAALGCGGAADAMQNLGSALTDLKRREADEVCIRTIERVVKQLAAVYEAINSQEQSA
jgi:hypothetical protein